MGWPRRGVVLAARRRPNPPRSQRLRAGCAQYSPPGGAHLRRSELAYALVKPRPALSIFHLNTRTKLEQAVPLVGRYSRTERLRLGERCNHISFWVAPCGEGMACFMADGPRREGESNHAEFESDQNYPTRRASASPAGAGMQQNKEIASQVSISPGTVKQHLGTMFLRVGIQWNIPVSLAGQALEGNWQAFSDHHRWWVMLSRN